MADKFQWIILEFYVNITMLSLCGKIYQIFKRKLVMLSISKGLIA